MPHITIIINREAPSTAASETGERPPGVGYVSASYVVPHEATDADIAQTVKKLYRQVKDLGT